MTDETDSLFRRAIAERVEGTDQPRPYWELPGLVHTQQPKQRWFDMGFRSNQFGLALAGVACLVLLGLGLWSVIGLGAGDEVQVTTEPTLPELTDEAADSETASGDGDEVADPAEPEPIVPEPTVPQATEPETTEPETTEPETVVEVLGPDGSGSGQMVLVTEAERDPNNECVSGRLGHRSASGDLHLYNDIGDVGSLRLYGGGDGQVAVVSNCEELVDTVIIATSSLATDGPPQLTEFPIPNDWLMFFTEPQVRYVDTSWIADVDRGNGIEEVRFELSTLNIVPTSEQGGTDPADSGDDQAGLLDVDYTCADQSTGTTTSDTADPEQIDDYINSIDLCEGAGGLQFIRFEASCGDRTRTVTVGAEVGVPDIATVDYCE